jgi:23S rRNA (cytidine1920-2'-O)/16S rRNA (cytidine1409-2'-O)-methyltransferase
MKRVDTLLFEQGFFESRKKAQVAISKGLVSLLRKNQKIKIEKSSQEMEVLPGDQWIIGEDLELTYVSRAGAKLHEALTRWQISVENKIVLDVGLSTGGFSDCLLQKGAKWICGVDVGHKQLHPRLQNHPQLLSIEKFNAKHILPQEILDLVEKFSGQTTFDLMVFDVSFISLEPVLKAQWPLLQPSGQVLALYKPQFEVGTAGLSKKGLAQQDEGLRVLQKTVKTLTSQGISVQDILPCSTRGEDGNQEYFLYIKKQ